MLPKDYYSWPTDAPPKLSHAFALAAPWIMAAEGGFIDDPADHGGATHHGWTLATLASLPDADGDGYRDGDIDQDHDVDLDDIRKLPAERAVTIYRSHIWQPNGCDALPPVVAVCLFDGLVNHKPGPAKRLLQMGLGVSADGVIGPRTIAAARQCRARDFITDYLSHRAEFYALIVRADSSQAKFRRGWFRRLFLLQNYLLSYVLPAQEGQGG